MKKLVLAFLLCVFVVNAWAYKSQVSSTATSGIHTSKTESLALRAATCAPANARQVMEFNNVSALLEQGGLLFLDRSLNKPQYEIPKGSGVNAIYGSSLWMGGTDASGNLKMAAIVNFRQSGNEFWGGPLVDQVGTTDEATCAEYDRFYYANRSEVLAFYNDYNDDGNVNTIPSNISNWPAFSTAGESLAPFYDANNNYAYDPENGDIPWFQYKGTSTELGCNAEHTVTMFGDQAFWWVFNDAGNIHSESGGEKLGMEVHAQAFAFNTDDEVNDMTFYNYELINRTTQSLYNTYFGNFFDCDLGYFGDDFVGCDVSRGLGYVYNGDPDDATTSGSIGYGLNPPAIGVDYFQGPYQDKDSIDNPLTTNYQNAIDSGGVPYKGIGIGYGDEIMDNERFGMREFMMFNGTTSASDNMLDPEVGKPIQPYYYLQGLWRDGSQPMFGGCGYPGQTNVTEIPTDYMMFYDSDPYSWATRGVEVPDDWREDLAGNEKGDRRFIQSSGPFTLEPGAYNNITIGVVYARSTSGNPFSSVEMVMHADDKAQALFDNCFKILEAPTAPDVTTQELDKEIILMLSNSPNGNNENENYTEVDPFIILPEAAPFNDTSLTQAEIDEKYRTYRFEGYLIYQLANETVGSSDLYNPDKARLVTQVDVKNGIKRLVNWKRDPVLGYLVPQLMVDGNDNGIKHSFSIKTDAFTQQSLVNHKSYYYMVMAYAHNEYLAFDPSATPNGQIKPFIQSRQNVSGAAVPVIKVIPHIPSVENGGTYSIAQYGSGPLITRIEGKGNGVLDLNLTPESEAKIVSDFFDPHPQYIGGEGNGPIEVKIIDPLNVTNHQFRIVFNQVNGSLNDATWTMIDLTSGQTFNADKAINLDNEQIFPQYGFSVSIKQWRSKEKYHNNPLDPADTTIFYRAEVIRSGISFSNAATAWVEGIKDQDGNSALNWIRSGSLENAGNPALCENAVYNDFPKFDSEEKFEKIINGTVAPYHLAARAYDAGGYFCAENTPVDPDFFLSQGADYLKTMNFGEKTVRNVDIVITADKSKWTRCPVFETTDDPQWAIANGQKQIIKELPSRDKSGNPGDGIVTTNENDADYVAATGMSWFPGYAIDVETGVRLNLGFGEDSRFVGENGRDMMWNPTANMTGDLGENLWGGKHYLYVFANTLHDPMLSNAFRKMPPYDYGKTLSDHLRGPVVSPTVYSLYWNSCTYVWLPMATQGYEINNPSTDIPCDVRMQVRVTRPYQKCNTNGNTFDLADLSGATNNWNNVYEFQMGGMASHTNETSLNDSILALINVVPNPYYAYSAYEANRLDNRVKIVNLPDECNIRIFTVSGLLVRTLTKATNSITSVDWDLKNQKGVPIAGGVYLIHVEVPGVGERVVKWFGALRPTDLDNF
ncbi:MAG TPA: hypothetical protein VK177_17680 [Flavobacteriales bacterium]|nr:hypothetical protein [Flavobacteriales bacterium]